MDKIERILKVSKLLLDYKTSGDERGKLLTEEKELRLQLDLIAPTFSDLNFKKMEKLNGFSAILKLQNNISIIIYRADSFMSNGVDTYEIAVSDNERNTTLEYQTELEINDLLAYYRQYVVKKTNQKIRILNKDRILGYLLIKKTELEIRVEIVLDDNSCTVLKYSIDKTSKVIFENLEFWYGYKKVLSLADIKKIDMKRNHIEFLLRKKWKRCSVFPSNNDLAYRLVAKSS